MARPFKPLAVHELNGTLQGRPGRAARRASEPQVEDNIGNPPKHLKPEAKKIWGELRKTIPWLTVADRVVFEMVCGLTVKLRSGVIKPQEIQILSSLCGRLGMTPADRAKVSMPSRKEKSESAFDFLDAPTDSTEDQVQ